MRVASMKRKNTRRQTVSPVCLYEFMVTYRSVQLFDDRFAIASINSEDGRDVLWTFVAKVVASLGTGGMSEDESSAEDPNERKFVIRIMDWRSARLLPYIQVVDRARKLTNIFSKFSAGNMPRKRTRLPGGRIWVERAVPGLPRNFYDDTWYAGLSEADRVALRAVDSVIFPPLI